MYIFFLYYFYTSVLFNMLLYSILSPITFTCLINFIIITITNIIIFLLIFKPSHNSTMYIIKYIHIFRKPIQYFLYIFILCIILFATKIKLRDTKWYFPIFRQYFHINAYHIIQFYTYILYSLLYVFQYIQNPFLANPM